VKHLSASPCSLCISNLATTGAVGRCSAWRATASWCRAALRAVLRTYRWPPFVVKHLSASPARASNKRHSRSSVNCSSFIPAEARIQAFPSAYHPIQPSLSSRPGLLSAGVTTFRGSDRHSVMSCQALAPGFRAGGAPQSSARPDEASRRKRSIPGVQDFRARRSWACAVPSFVPPIRSMAPL